MISRWILASGVLASGIACGQAAKDAGSELEDSGLDDLDGADSDARARCYALPRLFEPAAIEVRRDVAYAKDPTPFQRADIYSPPAKRGPYPAIVEVHGGGFIRGDKADFEESGRYWATRGIVSIAINYKLIAAQELGHEAAYPGAAKDVLCAIRAIRAMARAGRLPIDPDRVALRGGSAGATLVNLVALGGDGAPFDGSCDLGEGESARVQAAIDYYGVFDAAAFAAQTGSDGEAFLGPEPTPALIREASPITYVDSSDPPFVIGHGRADAIVPIAQSREARDRLLGVGVETDLVEVAGAGHGFIVNFEGAATKEVRCKEELLLAKALRPGETGN